MVMNKKAAITDIIVWIIISFVTLLILGSWLFAHNLLTTELLEMAEKSSTPMVNLTPAVEASFGQANSAMPMLRIIAFVIIFMLGFSIFISNYLVKANPIFFVVHFLMTILAVIFSVLVSNAYEELMTNNILGETLTSFFGGSFIMLNLPQIVAVIGLISGLFLFIGFTRDRELGGSII